jgi:Na+/proline symporter
VLFSSLRHYLSGSVKLGIGMGIVTILARWLTGNMLMTSPQILVKYGILGAVGYSFITGMAFVIFAFLAKRIRTELIDAQTIGDYLHYKLQPFGYKLMVGIMTLTILNSFFLQGVAAGMLFEQLTDMPVWIGLFLFFAVCVLYAGLGGAPLLNSVALFQVISVFAALILLSVYFFVREGITPIYDGMRLYHPYLLVVNNPDSWTFLTAGVFIGIGHVITDRTTWQRLFALEDKKIVSTLVLSGLIWSTLPLALSAIVMIAIFSGSFHNVYSLLFELIDQINSPLLLLLFLMSLVSAYTASFGAELHSLVSLLVRNVLQQANPQMNENQLLQAAYGCAVGIGLIGFMITAIFNPSPFTLFVCFGILYSSFLLPMIIMVMSRRKVGNLIPLSGCIAMVIAFLSIPSIGMLNSIFVAFAASLLQAVLYLGIKRA